MNARSFRWSRMQPRKPEASTPAEMVLTLKLDKPISDLTWIQKSLLFAELSRLSYASPEAVAKIAYHAGFDRCDDVEHDGAEGYVLGNRHDCIIVCRGTEPNQWNDIRADANAWTIASEVGRVHSGFYTEVNDLWPKLENKIKENQLPLWFAGHSLGGAMAGICAVRCKLCLYHPIPKQSLPTVHHALEIANTLHFSRSNIIGGSITMMLFPGFHPFGLATITWARKSTSTGMAGSARSNPGFESTTASADFLHPCDSGNSTT